ncbi:DUF2523 domain-containing protein [Neisseria meningitidis]|uniref:DUF2523 domain-containing protein n=1 Tax=Neisseria meningitidis TaxID=487 RepID=UPI0002A4D38A|nr:DUF2523 domain-containing protein [Neisseria meningitidis]ELK88126.1 hypothetical protein NMM7124_2127 [Neisseria meningitidis M7124]
MKLLAALIPLLMSVVGRILTALGLMAVTYSGVDRLVAHFQQAITHSITGAPQAMLQLFYISGGGTVLNILFGVDRLYSVIQTNDKTSNLNREEKINGRDLFDNRHARFRENIKNGFHDGKR